MLGSYIVVSVNFLGLGYCCFMLDRAVKLQIKPVSKKRDAICPGEKPTAATPESGLKPSGHFRLQQIKQCTS